jgi:hypothetical protein
MRNRGAAATLLGGSGLGQAGYPQPSAMARERRGGAAQRERKCGPNVCWKEGTRASPTT